jgi:dienelactone hydrolase
VGDRRPVAAGAFHAPLYARGVRRAVSRLLGLAVVLVGCAGRVGFPNATPDYPVRIHGVLVRPDRAGVAAPWPAVVLMHGCHGVAPQTERWARWLADRGYVALVVDSFGSRGLPGDCRADEGGRADLPNTARFDDAMGALRFLQAEPLVRADRVAIMGWSQGGVFALAAVNGPSLERARARGVVLPAQGFAAAVGIYPGGCPSLAYERAIRPVLILIGANDDWTPARFCEAMAQNMRAQGADVSIIVYPDAVHYFDVEDQRRVFLDDVDNLEKPGGGATVGYQSAAATRAYRDVERFLEQHLGPSPR